MGLRLWWPPELREDDLSMDHVTIATVTNDVELFRWLDEAKSRKRKLHNGDCGCGWTHEFPDGHRVEWEDHATVCIVAQLGDALASNTSGPEGRESWENLARNLYECIDFRDENCRCDSETWPWP
jgi:hypothetical protein